MQKRGFYKLIPKDKNWVIISVSVVLLIVYVVAKYHERKHKSNDRNYRCLCSELLEMKLRERDEGAQHKMVRVEIKECRACKRKNAKNTL